jgi:hypothetical protein
MLAPHLDAALPHRRAASLKTKTFVLIGTFVPPESKTKKNKRKVSRNRMLKYDFGRSEQYHVSQLFAVNE